MVIKKMNEGSLKIPYEAPLTEIVLVQSEGLMTPESWNDGQGGHFPIHEEDPDGDGKGAKGTNLWDSGYDNNMWDD